jgi:hypothetical protein
MSDGTSAGAGAGAIIIGNTAEMIGKKQSLWQRQAALKRALIALRQGQNERGQIILEGGKQIGNEGLQNQIAAIQAANGAASQAGGQAGVSLAGPAGGDSVTGNQADALAAMLFGHGIDQAQAQAGSAANTATGEAGAWNASSLRDILASMRDSLDSAAMKGMRLRSLGRGSRAVGVAVPALHGSPAGSSSADSSLGSFDESSAPSGASDWQMFGTTGGR